MASEHYDYVEQDRGAPGAEGDLPTYEDLAVQNGPNSRFGRWRGWIEKRAAERYADVTPEERQRRRAQGWDLPDRTPPGGPQPHPHEVPLHIHTANLSIQEPSELSDSRDEASIAPSLPFVSERMSPSHLKLNHFGSRFLPHTTSQIRCILPLIADRLILIGHDEGLSVLDMFPRDWTEGGEIAVKPPSEAQAHPIWHGETIYQMTILELEESGEGTPQGVVLALVGPEPESPMGAHKDGDFRVLRMYNLSSLTSLAKWAVAQKGARPLDLHRPSNWQAQQQTSPRRHRPQSSIARIKSLILDSPSPQHPEPTASYHTFLTSPPTATAPTLQPIVSPVDQNRLVPNRLNSEESSWDVVDDLPLRWATDFVPLASPGSRLASTAVISYAIWTDKNRRSTGGQLLAIATKNSILLYESPKGERAYRFVKDFYTPLQPKSLTFFDQLVQQEIPRIPGDSPGKHGRSASGASIRPVLNDQNDGTMINYGTQLSLFVVFDKKAGWIRLADSIVGEFELRDDGGPSANLAPSLSPREGLAPSTGSMSHRRSRLSFDIRESSAKWIIPTKCELPIPPEFNHFSSNAAAAGVPATRPVYLLTRGRRSHLLPCPLPSKSSSVLPIHVIYWKNAPQSVAVRICNPARGSIVAPPRFLRSRPALFQAVAFGESGVEVYETTIMSLFSGNQGANGKGKGRAVTNHPFDFVRAEEDMGGGEAGYLCAGGNWDVADEVYGGAGPYNLERSDTYASWPESESTFSSLESEAIMGVLKDESGMYGWCRKGGGDYRIFWVGGSYGDGDDDEDDDDIY